MRALLATSIGVLSTATLLLPPAALHVAAAAYGTPQASGTAPPNESPAQPGQHVPGSTQSLPLAAGPTASTGSTGSTASTDRAPQRGASAGADAPVADGDRRTVRPFSLVGAVWNDAHEHLEAEVQIRTRSAEDGSWSPWRTLESHPDHASSPAAHDGADGEEGVHRGSTAPLWVGRSDGVQVRIHAQDGRLPHGLRLELIDPGQASGDGAQSGRGMHTAGAPAGGPQDAGAREPSSEGSTEPLASLPELTKEETVDVAEQQGFRPDLAEADGEPHVGPRPGIVIRDGWGADADWREGGYAYGDDVRMAFVHHTAGSNGYSCKEAPKVIRGIYRYHVKSLGWRDIGYNFLIDKCGTIYEGRAGGVTEPVRGAHTLGFNNASMGVAVLGNFEKKKPAKKATDAIAKLTAWKLGLYGVNAEGTTRMTSAGGKYPKGDKVKMHTVSGHRDGFATACPGKKLYDELPDIRKLAARLQGRR